MNIRMAIAVASAMLLAACTGGSDQPSNTSAASDASKACPSMSGSLSETVVELGMDGRTFAWAAAEGAERYMVVVYDSGKAYWSWTGVDTTVDLGARPEDAGGPQLPESLGWRVVALDAAGAPIGTSACQSS